MPTANSLLAGARTEEQPMTNRPNLMTVEAAKGLSVQERCVASSTSTSTRGNCTS